MAVAQWVEHPVVGGKVEGPNPSRHPKGRKTYPKNLLVEKKGGDVGNFTIKRTPVIRHFLSLMCRKCNRDIVLTVGKKTYSEIEPAVGKKSLPDLHHLWCPFCGGKDLALRDHWEEMHEHLSVESGYEPPKQYSIGPEEPGY